MREIYKIVMSTTSSALYSSNQSVMASTKVVGLLFYCSGEGPERGSD